MLETPNDIDAAERTGDNLLSRMASVLAGRMLHSMDRQQQATEALERVLRAAHAAGRIPDKIEVNSWRAVITAHANAVKLHQAGIKLAKDATLKPKDNRPKQIAR